jgi:hypothetical protein
MEIGFNGPDNSYIIKILSVCHQAAAESGINSGIGIGAYTGRWALKV